MPIRLDARADGFAERFRAFLATKREVAADVEAAVRAIIADVVARGDRALIELTRKFDRVDLDELGLKVTAAEIDTAYAACDRRDGIRRYASSFSRRSIARVLGDVTSAMSDGSSTISSTSAALPHATMASG